jgi:hypothetical protein
MASASATFPNPASTSTDRRSGVRFPLRLRVHFRTLGRGSSFSGLGWVVNMSSVGALIDCQHELRANTRIELSIQWPSLLDGRVRLQLFAVGRVVRCEGSRFAVVLVSHQFRTTRKGAIPIDATGRLGI